MDDIKRTKSILRKPLLGNNNNSSTPSSSSWLTRIQSRLSTSQQDDSIIQLQRQDLKRVTFSMGRLTTEHILFDHDSDAPPSSSDTTTPVDDYTHSLPLCYEKACRLREEKQWPLFMNLLQTHKSKALTTIDLSNQPIGLSMMGPLADILLLDFGLRSLHLSNCGLEDESVGPLLNSILMTDRVTELDLSSNPFKSKAYKFISIYIVESSNIKSLDLSKCSPDRRAIQYLSRAFLYTTSLQHINMDQCALKPTHLEIMAPNIWQSPSLISLSLRYNRLSSSAAHWLATLILNEQQDIYWNDTEGAYVGDYNETSGGLQRLDLSGNSLQDAAIGPLCQALYSNRTLRSLSLADCKIQPNGCEMIADALFTNQYLTNLDLSGNPIIHNSDDGIHALKMALLRNSTLQELVLTDTDLDATAAITLAEVLPMNAALTRLDLSQNPSISLAGILALSISIKMNHTLTFLDVSIPNNDRELSELQNDIAAVCTNNMIRRIEQQQDEMPLDPKTITSSSTTLSSSPSSSTPSTSSSSVTSSSSHTSTKENDPSYEQRPPSIKIPSPHTESPHPSNQENGASEQISPLDEISLLDDM